MKTTLLVLLLTATIILPKISNAQYRAFVLGIKAAPSISWLKTTEDNYNNEGAKIGFSWGLASEFYFAKNYAFATGLNFIYQGGKLSYPDIINDEQITLKRDYRIRYLELPAVLKMKTDEMGKFRYYGQIGLGFGIRINSLGKDEYRDGGRTITEDYDDIDKQTRLFRTSMIIGAGIEYPLNNTTALIAGLNFNNGFTNALKGDNVVNTSASHIGKPNFVELNLGVMF